VPVATVMSRSRVMYAGVFGAKINGGAEDPELENAKVVAQGECLQHLTAEREESHSGRAVTFVVIQLSSSALFTAHER
jgi:hypothetical protein